MNMDLISAKLDVDRALLISAMRVLEPEKESLLKGQDAVLDFRDGALQITLGEIAAGVEAEGFWPGRARLPGANFPNLAKAIPRADGHATLLVKGGKLWIGTFSIDCYWETGTAATAITLPLENPSPLTLLRLGAAHSDEAVRAAGLTKPIAEAHRWLSQAIAVAADQLTPFEIEPQSLRDWVVAQLRLERPSDAGLGPTQGDLGLHSKGDQMLLGDE